MADILIRQLTNLDHWNEMDATFFIGEAMTIYCPQYFPPESRGKYPGY